MYGRYVLRLTGVDGEYCIEKIKAEEALWSAIFGVNQGNIPYTISKELTLILNQLFEDLTEEETEVLKLRFGFYGEFYSLRKAGEQINLTAERVRQIEKKALRKLRHPSRSRKLRNIVTKDIILQSSEEANYFKHIVIDKIAAYIGGRSLHTGFLSKILQQSGLVITGTPAIGTNYNMALEEFELDVRTYNCLKYNKINTIGELLTMTEDDIVKLRHIGKRGAEELLEKIKLYKLEGEKLSVKTLSDKWTTVKIAYNGIEQIYKFKGTSESDIAESVYDVLVEEYSKQGTIIDYKMSFELKFLLLFKGYFFVENMLADSEKIINELTVGKYDTYADEYKAIEKQIKAYWDNELNQGEIFLILKNKMVKNMLNNMPNTHEELYECLTSDEERRDVHLRQFLYEKKSINIRINVPDSDLLEAIESDDILELDDERISTIVDLETD